VYKNHVIGLGNNSYP